MCVPFQREWCAGCLEGFLTPSTPPRKPTPTPSPSSPARSPKRRLLSEYPQPPQRSGRELHGHHVLAHGRLPELLDGGDPVVAELESHHRLRLLDAVGHRAPLGEFGDEGGVGDELTAHRRRLPVAQDLSRRAFAEVVLPRRTRQRVKSPINLMGAQRN